MRTVLTVLSGLSFWLLLHLEDRFDIDPFGAVGYALTGGIFGLLVLLPFIASRTWWYGRAVGLVLGSIVIYALVVELAIDGYGPLDLDEDVAIVASGLAGALLVGALTKWLAPLFTAVKFWPYLLAAGAVGGLIFSVLWRSDYAFVMSVGYVAWQVPVFAALHWGSK